MGMTFVKLIYLFASIIVVGYIINLLIKNPRLGVLTGLTFTSFTLFALPWQLFPIWGVQSIVKNTFVAFSFILYMKKPIIKNYKIIVIIIFIWVVMIAFLPIAGINDYGTEKALRFIDKVILPIIAFSVFTPLTDSDCKQINKTVVVGGFLVILYIISYGEIIRGRAYILNAPTATITLGRMIGAGAVIALTNSFTNANINKKERVGLIFISIILLYGTILAGSRAPLMTILFALGSIFICSLSFKEKKKMIFRVIILLSIILIWSAFWGDNYKLLDNRVITFLLDPTGLDSNALERLNLYGVALKGFIESGGLGVGTGGFSTIQGATQYWPHNIFLEFVSEFGIVGLIIFTYLIVKTIKFIAIKPKQYNSYEKSMHALWFYSFYNALLSYDITNNYIFWISTCLVWMVNLEKSSIVRSNKYLNSYA